MMGGSVTNDGQLDFSTKRRTKQQRTGLGSKQVMIYFPGSSEIITAAAAG